MVFVCGRLTDLLHVDRVLQLANVLLVRRDVQQRCQWFSQLDREISISGREQDGQINATSVASIKIIPFC